jgi:O-antigen/teichoic acid export membrane protein
VSESDNREECAKFYSGVFKYYIAVMFAGGGILAVGAQIFAKILFAESYFNAWVFIPVLSAAMVFTALDTFLGSAYFTVRKTGMSFWTSFVGAVLNIVLNILFIPTWGAMGASLATYASYFVVFVIRAVTMHKFIPFKMYPVRLVLNIVMITAIATVMSLWGDRSEGLLVSLAILVVCLVLNGRDIVSGCLDVLRSLKRRKSKTEQ